MLTSIKTVLFSIFTIAILSCQSETETSKTLSPEETQGQELLDKTIKAHGGLTTWNSFEGLSYNLANSGKNLYQITQLHDRRTYTKADDFEIGYDGKVAWSLPNAEKVPGKAAAFYYNLDFYFAAIPFVLKDKGVNVFYDGKVTINEKEYESLKVTFGSEIGLTPEDVYYLYIDPNTSLLEILTYSVSFFDKENAGINSAKVYSDWQNVEGIMMPGSMRNFAWKDGVMGEENTNYKRVFSDYKFLESIPDNSVFEVPEGGVIENI
ncbi:DUF6503 family protein [Arcticibacterium luteifluviistationis]|uniref:Threonine synthase n=1 Tax=Arcticibacterium luteifluviistationis TaxID=1784714 RepID=A0A2Z4GC95_9BACT|nr:DUF6503 family protein [Arcticibacterium luteifluviistationis]AWV98919.1 hypothetical protein DJ013_12350 [Arcticibacterium luteifluviistationis]